MNKYNIGETVYRLNDDRSTIVLEFILLDNGYAYNIEYSEGGNGWWMEEDLTDIKPELPPIDEEHVIE